MEFKKNEFSLNIKLIMTKDYKIVYKNKNLELKNTNDYENLLIEFNKIKKINQTLNQDINDIKEDYLKIQTENNEKRDNIKCDIEKDVEIKKLKEKIKLLNENNNTLNGIINKNSNNICNTCLISKKEKNIYNKNVNINNILKKELEDIKKINKSLHYEIKDLKEDYLNIQQKLQNYMNLSKVDIVHELNIMEINNINNDMCKYVYKKGFRKGGKCSKINCKNKNHLVNV